MAPERKWTAEQLAAQDAVSKSDLVTFLQANASNKFLRQHKVFGQAKNVLKQTKREDLVKAYEALFATGDFRTPADDEELAKAAAATAAPAAAESASEETKPKAGAAPAATPAKDEPPKYTKTVLKKGDKVNFPKPGDQVAVKYTGKLDSGFVFDTNTDKKGKPPLRFKVGKGIVIRGWDEALLTMSKGEQARIVIEPEWAYGKKGKPEAGIPPDARLTFEMELLDIN